MTVLALNAGSISLKFALFSERLEPLLSGDIEWRDDGCLQAEVSLRRAGQAVVKSQVALKGPESAAEHALTLVTNSGLGPVGVVGHRVVHGGAEFRESVRVDDRVKATVKQLCGLAPLHNPPALTAMEAIGRALPSVPEVAAFDTALYASLPPRAYLYPLPWEWHERWGVRRFGFHGLSHSYCAGRAADLLGREDLRVVSCHLGGGCSATALRNGIPVATTMGFTPMEGLMMSTRCGSVDPGLLLHLHRQCGLSVDELDRALNKSSGLLGVSGVSPYLSAIEVAAQQGNPRAALAFDMFADRVKGTIGSLSAALGGVDAIIFTAGIGERSARLRAAACEGLQFMGIELDSGLNLGAMPDCDVAAQGSKVRVLVIRTREDLVVAREAVKVLGSA